MNFFVILGLAIVFMMMSKNRTPEPVTGLDDEPGKQINGNSVLDTFQKTHDKRPMRNLILRIYAVLCLLAITPLVIFGVRMPGLVIFCFVLIFICFLMWMDVADMKLKVWVSLYEMEFNATLRFRESRHIVKISDIEKMELVKMSLLFSQGYHSSAFERSNSKAVMYVSGNRAVKITLKDRKRIFVSLDEPEEFMNMIERLRLPMP